MLGIYFHIPFCAGRCAYCDFYTCAGRDDRMDAYQRALLKHLSEAEEELKRAPADTVYFGGGTPSYYGAERLCRLLDGVKEYGLLLKSAEVTAEVNPGTVTAGDLRKLRRAGFNRLSIGVQSANDGILRSQGRLHTFADAVKTVRDARHAGFDNVSCDVIYGLPGQTREDWADTVLRVAGLKPEHISCYGLKIAEGTPLWPYRDSPFIPDGDTQADMYLFAVDTLQRYGYHQYEISNFALRGRESRHNLKYWQGEDYLGFGAGAHSCYGGRRFSIAADTDKYIRDVNAGEPLLDHSEWISPFEQASEYLMLGLRTVRGICEQEYRQKYACSFDEIRRTLEGFANRGLARETGGRWSLTTRGFLVSNVLIGEILEAQGRQKEADGTPWVQRRDDSQMSLFAGQTEVPAMFRGI